MIRARLQARGRQMMVIGLSGENVTRLAAGEPILSRMDEIGFPDTDLLVLYGKTEDDIRADLEQLVAAVQAGKPTQG